MESSRRHALTGDRLPGFRCPAKKFIIFKKGVFGRTSTSSDQNGFAILWLKYPTLIDMV